MTTKTLQFFCEPEEFLEMFREFSTRIGRISYFKEEGYDNVSLARVGFDEIFSVLPRLFWLSATVDDPASFLGLIQITTPQCKDKALCMASIAIKTEGSEGRYKENLLLYERLRKFISQRLKSGLWGINTKLGGEHFYRKIYISDGAISEFRHGRELVPWDESGSVRFQYRVEDGSEKQ